jgi:hypothetical protein
VTEVLRHGAPNRPAARRASESAPQAGGAVLEGPSDGPSDHWQPSLTSHYQHDLLLTANRTLANSAPQTIGQDLMIFKPPRHIAGTARAPPVILAMKTVTPFLLVALAAGPAGHAFDRLVLRLASHRTARERSQRFWSKLELWNGVKHSGDRHRKGRRDSKPPIAMLHYA